MSSCVAGVFVKQPISVTILSKNSERYLTQVLESVRDFSEVILLDNGSEDQTLAIAAGYSNVRVIHEEFCGFGRLHQIATERAKNDWILSLDSDEVLSQELQKEIQGLELDPGEVYSFPRHNYYKGKWIRHCAWYPDRQVRIYNRLRTGFSDAEVHETVLTDGMKKVFLSGPMIHYSYLDSSDFLRKMAHYSELFAQQNQHQKSSSLGKACCHGVFAFFKTYVIKKGILSGREGFEIALYNANTAFYKYMRLAELNRGPRTSSRSIS